MMKETRRTNSQGQLMGTPMREETESYEVEFTPPNDAELDGDNGTATVNWRRKSNGKVCITAINGVSLGGESEEVTETETESEEVQPISEEA